MHEYSNLFHILNRADMPRRQMSLRRSCVRFRFLRPSVVGDQLLVECYRIFRSPTSQRISEVDVVESKFDTVSEHPLEIVHQRPRSVADHVTAVQLDGCTKYMTSYQ
jgi:hypothetical protein